MDIAAAKTGSDNYTIWIEDGEVVYPCPCGETHRGDYAIYDFGHHTHNHDEVFWDFADMGICTDCGATIRVIDGRDV